MGVAQSDLEEDSDDGVEEARRAAAALTQALFQTHFFAMAFRGRKGDTLRVINADAKTVLAIQEACARSWSDGINGVTSEAEGMVVDIRLHGKVFYHRWRELEERVPVLELTCSILETLLREGWRVVTAPNLDYADNMSTIIFERCSQSQPLPASQTAATVLSVTPTSRDGLLLVHAEDFCEELTAMTRNIISENQVITIRDEIPMGPDHQFVMNREPFGICLPNEELAESRLMIMKLLHFLSTRNWQLYAVLDSGSQPYEHMGSLFLTESTSSPPLSGPLLSLDFQAPDKVHLVGVNEEIVAAVRRSILTYWPKGIRLEDRTCMEQARQAHHFTLQGSPWCQSHPFEWTLVVLSILRRLRRLGWEPLGALDLTGGPTGASTLLFKRCAPGDHEHCALEFAGSGTNPYLHIVNANEQVVQDCRNVIATWPKGVYREARDQADSYSIRLAGKPLTHYHGDNVHFIGLLCLLLTQLRASGWQLAVSADINCCAVTASTERECQVRPADRHILIFYKETERQRTLTKL